MRFISADAITRRSICQRVIAMTSNGWTCSTLLTTAAVHTIYRSDTTFAESVGAKWAAPAYAINPLM